MSGSLFFNTCQNEAHPARLAATQRSGGMQVQDTWQIDASLARCGSRDELSHSPDISE